MPSYDVDLVADLPGALRDGRFVLHFQPEVDLASGAVAGMEALLRWDHPARGLLWPAQFLPAVEAAGLSVEVGRWVVERCVAEAMLWQRLPRGGPRLWLNVATTHLAAPGFADHLIALVRAKGLAGALGVEVGETAAAGCLVDHTAVLTALRAAGVGVALDDFGTWWSTLSHLDELPLDVVKLDQGFVRGAGLDPEDDAVLASVIGLAHEHGVEVVAEGVESWTESARLCELGCDRAHGWLFGGPQPPDRARRLLADRAGWRAGDPPAGLRVPEARRAPERLPQT